MSINVYWFRRIHCVISMAQASAANTAPAWRQFPFFDVVPVKDIHDLASPPEVFQKTPEISTIAPSSAGLVVADIHGSVYLVNRDFEIAKSWIAHTGGRVTHMAERKGILVTLGEEDTARHPFLKVWDLQAFDKKTGAPLLLRSAKVQSGNRPHPVKVSVIALSASLSYLAIGLGDGTVILYRHLDQSIYSTSGSLSTLPKPRVIHESATEPITGLGFREPAEDSPNVYLFIVTTSRVLCYQASGKGSGGTPAVVDDIGAGLGCATMDWKAREVVIARDEAIYLFGTESRGPKSSIQTHRNYIVIVSPPFTPSASAASATVRNFVAKSSTASGSDITKVTVFDPENQYVAHSDTLTEGVREVFSAWGKLYVLSNDGKLLCLEEKPTSVKLDMLYRKGLYTLALNIAETQKLDDAHIADIHKQYGDHLYAKGDYDNAMQQYIQTIGHVQPSYVIRKRIHNLVTYLQELHSLGLANSDHTTLLLNTYTKLKDVSRLDSFIKRESLRTSADGEKDELPFDLDTAIRVCRQAGYFEHASYLAKKYERHEDYLRIQIEDAGNYKDALLYLRRLGAEAAESNLARYGRAMLNNLPEETTDLLIDICTSLSPLSIESDEQEVAPAKQSSGGPSYLSYLALNRASVASSSSPAENSPSGTQTNGAKVPEATLRRDSVHEDSRTSTPPPTTPTTAAPTKARAAAVKRPSPRLYFAHFVDHPNHFVRFLETVARRRWGQAVDNTSEPLPVEADPNADDQAEQRDQAAVWNTLFELYLTQTSSDTGSNTKALAVLQNPRLPYDPTHALILCSTRGFTPGLVLLWERMGMQEDVIRFFMDRHQDGDPDASGEVVRRLDQYGPGRPQLYPLVLRFLTSTPALLTKHREDVVRVLKVIDEEKIMPPVSVVQVLSRNSVASVGLVKEWLMARIKSAREEVDIDQKLIASYRSDTEAKLRQVEELSDPDHPRVFHVTQCSSCQGGLDLPAVHFMCNHSYHQRCLPQNETECPNCAREHGIIREIRRNNERLADQHDLFLSEVREGGFDALATGFSRGILNLSRAEDVGA
ncbi:hypothetical protein ACG7TL_003290 [Trametes sanguinea]